MEEVVAENSKARSFYAYWALGRISPKLHDEEFKGPTT